jgi:hypothetical protein
MSQTWKTVRVFISSTFRDMHAERDHLVKVVFPALRERLEPYRVNLIDIDLRWGVTKEQADNDQVLDVCLRQIDECRPFFIGLLGERYGWVPLRFPAEAVKHYGWVQQETGKSVTELEILHGVLNNPEMRGHAFFYFRDPTALGDVPPPIREVGFKQMDPVLIDHLRELKDAVRRSGYPVMDPYQAKWDPQAYDRPSRSRGRLAGLEIFGKRVFDQLWEAVQAELKLPEAPPTVTLAETDPLAEEADYHARFMESRVRVFVGRRELQNKLTAYLESDSTCPLILTGGPGSGKSAIMSKLCQTWSRQHGDRFVLAHFVGASIGSSDTRVMLRRFCQEMRCRFDLTEILQREDGKTERVPRRVPDDVSALLTAFRETLENLPRENRFVLIVDGIDQIESSNGVDVLDWLPASLPANVKIVVSCADDATSRSALLARLRARQKMVEVRVAPLTVWEAARILRDLPSVSAKTLDSQQRRMLIGNPASGNPLFLTVAIEELRGFGSFDQLNDRIASLPREGDTVVEMFYQVITRLTQDFDEGVVRHVLSYLGASRAGLSESELRCLLEREHAPGIEDLYPILRQIRPYLLRREDLVWFYHAAFHAAVIRHLLDDASSRADAHHGLAILFDAKADPDRNATFSGPARALAELPYHLDGAEDHTWAVERLRDLPRTQFTAQKVARTHDVAATSKDYGFFLKACLRQKDFGAALQLARARSGLAQLKELVVSPQVGSLAPLLSPESPLWLQAQQAILGLPSGDERIGRLTAFVHPGLSPALYEWHRAQFRRDADSTSKHVRCEFLVALARSEDSAMDFILSFLDLTGIPGELATILVERFRMLHRGISIEPPLEILASLATRSSETFTALTDALGRNDDRAVAAEGIETLAQKLSNLRDSRWMPDCAAALSHAYSRLGDVSKAERLATQCLDHFHSRLPEDFDFFRMSSLADSAGRMVLAAAPFPSVWPRATDLAERVMASLTSSRSGDPKVGESFRAAAKAHAIGEFLRATPWVTRDNDRIAWLEGVLNWAEETAREDVGEDPAQQFIAIFGGRSPQEMLVDPIEAGLVDLCGDIDRVMRERSDPDLLMKILMTAAQVRLTVGKGQEQILNTLERLVPQLASSSNPQTGFCAINLLLQVTAEANLVNDKAGDIFLHAIRRMTSTHSPEVLQLLLERVFTDAENLWVRRKSASAIFLLAALLRSSLPGETEPKPLNQQEKAVRGRLVVAFRERLLRWQNALGEKYREMVTIMWASGLIAFGLKDDAERMLRDLRAKYAGRSNGNDLSLELKMMMADTLVQAGANQEADELLNGALPRRLDLGEAGQIKESLRRAKIAVMAAGSNAPSGRRLFLDAARVYREQVGLLPSSVEGKLLNATFQVRDRDLTLGYIHLAEQELVQSVRVDSLAAVLWYATLALSCQGNLAVAKQAREELSDWPTKIHEANVRKEVLSIEFEKREGGQVDPRLGQINQELRAIGDPKARVAVMSAVCALVAHGPDALFDQALTMILETAGEMREDTGRMATVLERLCERLNQSQLTDAIPDALKRIVDFLEDSDGQDLADLKGYVQDLLHKAIDLASKEPEPDRHLEALRRLVRLAVLFNNPEAMRDFVRKALGSGLESLPLTHAADLLASCKELAQSVEDAGAYLFSLADMVARSWPPPAVEVELRGLLTALESRWPKDVSSFRCGIYRELARRRVAQSLMQDLAGRIEHDGPPRDIVGQARWAALLTGTPLQPLAGPVVNALLQNLDGFAQGATECRSLEQVLEAGVQILPPASLGDAFARLVDWTAEMPLVLNEDWRRLVFGILLRAANALPVPLREPTVAMIAHRAAEVLPKGQKLEVSLAAVDPATAQPETVGARIELMLEQANCDPASAYTAVIDLALCLAEGPISVLNDKAAQRICDNLACYAGNPCKVRYWRLTQAVENCQNSLLRSCLAQIVLQTNEATCLASLDPEDLDYLLCRSVKWWVEHSAQMIVEDASASRLLEWIEEASRRAPEVLEVAIALASAWLSSDDPAALSGFWFDLANHSMRLDPLVRRTVAEAAMTLLQSRGTTASEVGDA